MVSKQEVLSTAALEVVALAEQQNALFQPILAGLESRDTTKVASASQELSWHRAAALGVIEQVGVASADAQEELVTLLITNALYARYGNKVEIAYRLNYDFAEGQTFGIAVLSEVLQELVAASDEFDISRQDLEAKMLQWLAHTLIEEALSGDQTTRHFNQQLVVLDELVENEELPVKVRALLVARTQKGKEQHAQKLFESAKNYKPNSVELSYAGILYGSVQEDIQRLHMCGISEEQIQVFAQTSLQQLNAEHVTSALQTASSLNRVQGLLLQLPWMLKDEALASELDRLGVTSDSFARLIALSLNKLVLSSALVSLAKSVESLDRELLQKILESYFEHVGTHTSYEVRGTGLVGVAQKHPLRRDDFETLETIVKSAGMDWFSETVQAGLRRIQAG